MGVCRCVCSTSAFFCGTVCASFIAPCSSLFRDGKRNMRVGKFGIERIVATTASKARPKSVGDGNFTWRAVIAGQVWDAVWTCSVLQFCHIVCAVLAGVPQSFFNCMAGVFGGNNIRVVDAEMVVSQSYRVATGGGTVYWRRVRSCVCMDGKGERGAWMDCENR